MADFLPAAKAGGHGLGSAAMGSRLLRLTTLVALVAALGFAACGNDDDDDGASTQAAEEQPTATEPSPADEQAALKDTSVKPEIPKPTGAPPRKLEIVDIVKGKGPAAKAGDNVTVHYAGVTFSTGEEFDASWTSGQPYSFPLGGGQVIQGWDIGVEGMKKGGRRQLTIPPELAYGAQGSPPVIGPNETLVFVIDMLEIQ
jgi:peptidylprolyl isomerase